MSIYITWTAIWTVNTHTCTLPSTSRSFKVPNLRITFGNLDHDVRVPKHYICVYLVPNYFPILQFRLCGTETRLDSFQKNIRMNQVVQTTSCEEVWHCQPETASTDGKTDRYCSKLILVASLSGTPSSSCETQLQAQADTTACHIQTKHVSVNMQCIYCCKCGYFLLDIFFISL